MVHFDGLDFSGQLARSEGDDGTGLQDTGFNTADWHCTNTADFVDVLQGQTEGLVRGAGRGEDGIQSFQQGLAAGLAFLALNFPSLEPGQVGRWFQHVVSVPSGNRDEGDGHWVVTDLLDVAADFLLDFVEAFLAEGGFSVVHLVDTNDQLLDTQSVGQEGVFAGLAVLGDTSFEFTSTTGDDQHGTISLLKQQSVNKLS